MKQKYLLLYLLCLCTAMPFGAKAQSTMTYTLNFDPSDFTINQINGDTSIITSTKYDIYSNYNPQQPDLPVIYVTLLLPPNASYESFTYSKTENSYANNVILQNGRKPIPTNSTAIENQNKGRYNAQLFNSNVQYVQNSVIGGYRIVTFKVMPFSYNSVTGELFISNFTLYVLTRPAEQEILSNSERGKRERNYIEEKVWNKEILQTFYPTALTKGYVNPTNGKVLKNRYIIITNDTLVDAFQPLLEWKRLKGLDAEIKTISTIPQWSGYSVAKNIKRYLKDLYEGNNKKDSIEFYVLLGGDVNIIPTAMCHIYYPEEFLSEDVPCDMYYACVKGSNWSWDSNNNGVLGENSDGISWSNDLYVSRASVRTINQAKNFVEKILQYETNPPVDKNWGDSILFVGGTCHHKYNDNTYELISEDSRVMGDSIYNQEIKPYWNGERKYLFVTGNNLNYGLASNNSYIDSTRTAEQLGKNYSFVLEMSHGDQDRWAYYKMISSHSYTYVDIFDSSKAESLVSSFPKVLITCACNTNKFDYSIYSEEVPCLSERLMRNINSGIVAYVGSSREGYNVNVDKYNNADYFYYSNRFNRDFVRALYNTSVIKDSLRGKHLGQIVNYAKSNLNPSDPYEKKLRFTINTLGDPEMPIFTNCPKQFHLTYEPYLTENGDMDNRQINVVVGQTDFYVYVEKEDKLYRYMIGDKFPLSIDCDSTQFVVMKQGFVPKRVKIYSSLYLQNKTINTNTNYSNYSRIFVGRNVYNDAVGLELEEDGDVIINSGAKLSLKANNQVLIKNGFKVNSGGTFEMDINN